MTGFADSFGSMGSALGSRKAGHHMRNAAQDYARRMNALGAIQDMYFFGPELAGKNADKLIKKFGKRGYISEPMVDWLGENNVYESYEPWIDSGKNAQNALSDLVLGRSGDDLYDNPVFKNMIDTSEATINRNALATGVYGGNRSKALKDNALGTNQNWLTNLSNLSSTGLNATNSRNQAWDTFTSNATNLRAGGAAGAMQSAAVEAQYLQAGYAEGWKGIGQGVDQIMEYTGMSNKMGSADWGMGGGGGSGFGMGG